VIHICHGGMQFINSTISLSVSPGKNKRTRREVDKNNDQPEHKRFCIDLEGEILQLRNELRSLKEHQCEELKRLREVARSRCGR
jgi:hypothetical protein